MNSDRSVENLEQDTIHKLWGKDSNLSKVDIYKWNPLGKKGKMEWIPKSKLKLDLSYQREMDSRQRVRRICREFDWALFGVIIVCKSKDGFYYVLDGGHRTRAANRREDITELPCIVFEIDNVSEEARIFYDYNNQRKSVNTFDNHKAALKANMEVAHKAENLVKKYGYTFSKGGKGQFQTSAIKTVYKMIESDEALAEKCFSVMAKVSEGGDVQHQELIGLFHIMERNRSIDYFTFPLKNLAEVGIGNIRDAIKRQLMIEGKGGDRICAKALVDIINKGQVKNKVSI